MPGKVRQIPAGADMTAPERKSGFRLTGSGYSGRMGSRRRSCRPAEDECEKKTKDKF